MIQILSNNGRHYERNSGSRIVWKKKSLTTDPAGSLPSDANTETTSAYFAARERVGEKKVQNQLTTASLMRLYHTSPYEQQAIMDFIDIYSEKPLSPLSLIDFSLPRSEAIYPTVHKKRYRSTISARLNLFYLPSEYSTVPQNSNSYVVRPDRIIEPRRNLFYRNVTPLWFDEIQADESAKDEGIYEAFQLVKNQMTLKTKSVVLSQDGKPPVRDEASWDLTNKNALNAEECKLGTNLQIDKFQEDSLIPESPCLSQEVSRTVFTDLEGGKEVKKQNSAGSGIIKEFSSDSSSNVVDIKIPPNEEVRSSLSPSLEAFSPEEASYGGNPFSDPSLQIKETENIWYYKNTNNNIYGPFTSTEMNSWYRKRCFPSTLLVRCKGVLPFTELGQFLKLINAPEIYCPSIAAVAKTQSTNDSSENLFLSQINDLLRESARSSSVHEPRIKENSSPEFFSQDNDSSSLNMRNSLPERIPNLESTSPGLQNPDPDTK